MREKALEREQQRLSEGSSVGSKSTKISSLKSATNDAKALQKAYNATTPPPGSQSSENGSSGETPNYEIVKNSQLLQPKIPASSRPRRHSRSRRQLSTMQGTPFQRPDGKSIGIHVELDRKELERLLQTRNVAPNQV